MAIAVETGLASSTKPVSICVKPVSPGLTKPVSIRFKPVWPGFRKPVSVKPVFTQTGCNEIGEAPTPHTPIAKPVSEASFASSTKPVSICVKPVSPGLTKPVSMKPVRWPLLSKPVRLPISGSVCGHREYMRFPLISMRFQ